MKFCAVLGSHPSDQPGGAELQSHLICAELARRGHEAYYVAFDAGQNERRTQDGVTVVRLDTDGRYRSVRSVLDTITSLDPDVLYYRIIKDLPIATVTSHRTSACITFNVSHDAHCLPRFATWPGKDDSALHRDVYRRSKLAVLRSLLTVPDRVFVQTRTQQRLLDQHRGIDSVRTGNGQPVPEGEPTKHSPPVVLWLASIKRWKQPQAFLDAAESCADLDCEFWMVGQPTDGELADAVGARAEGLPNVEYFGACSIEESSEFIERAAVFVNTSRQEGFPNTFIQSWLRKTPVVSLHADPRDERGAPTTGYYGTDSEAELVARIRELIANPARREALGERAFACAKRDYAIERVVDTLVESLPARYVQ